MVVTYPRVGPPKRRQDAGRFVRRDPVATPSPCGACRLPDVADHVELDVPLSSRYASTVRAVAASVCAELGFSVDDIDDLRLGVNEAVSILSDVDGDGRLHISFEASDGAVMVRCSRRGVDRPVVADDIDVLARRILDAVVDEYSVDEDGRITVVKRLGAAVR